VRFSSAVRCVEARPLVSPKVASFQSIGHEEALPTQPSLKDLLGKDKPQPPPLETSFALPPFAMMGNVSGNDRSSASPVKPLNSSYHPASPPLDSPVSSSRNGPRASGTGQGMGDFTIPPPPTKIFFYLSLGWQVADMAVFRNIKYRFVSLTEMNSWKL
jgi:hypothetical protein